MENIATLKEMKAEALRRMRLLGIDGHARRVIRSGHLWVSENQRKHIIGFPRAAHDAHGMAAVLYDINGYTFEDGAKAAAKRVEAFGGFPYHVIVNQTEFGTLYSVLYVTKHKDEWQMDLEDLYEQMPCAACTNGQGMDIGRIGIRMWNGGVLRVA